MLDKAKAPAEVLQDQGRGEEVDSISTDKPTPRKSKRKTGNVWREGVNLDGQRLATATLVSPEENEPTAAPAMVYGRGETDEDYEGEIARAGALRIVNCPHNLQWIFQSFSGGRWRNKSFHRERTSLVNRYGPIKMILALPEHHNAEGSA